GLMALGTGAHALAAWQGARQLVAADPDRILATPALRATAIAQGGPLFARHCAACHNADGRGRPDLGAPDLTDADWLYGSGRVDQIEQIIRHGIRAGDTRGQALADMPAFGRARPSASEPFVPLGPGEIALLVDWLHYLEGRAPLTGPARAGGQIYAGKGGCWDCHGADGHGDPAIGAPDLADRVWLYGDGSAGAIARSITYGRRGVMPAFARRLSAAETRALAAYVATLASPHAPAA
ncbi:MAG TPA: c-type cytochrome, partial [Novosphingobium sp.]|nr:c-type cytochrome [Novosphingobium sp.]